MKRVILFAAIVLTTITASAQVYVGGALSLWRQTEAESTLFTIAPSVGYEFNEKWAAGGEIAYSFATHSHSSFEFAPYARFSYYQNSLIKLFLDMGFGLAAHNPYVGDNVFGFQIGVQPGLAVKLNKHFSMLAKVGFVGYDGKYSDPTENGFGILFNGGNLSFGVEYTF